MSALETPSFLSVLVTSLRSSGCVFAEEEAQLLLDEARTPLQLQQMVDRRLSGEPLEHILGWVRFCDGRVAVTPGVFVPRRRTEFLVECALRQISSGSIVADLCCGSGAVAATIGRARSDVDLWATDIDQTAVKCARGNLGRTATVLTGDLFAPLPDELRGKLDLVVASAPYVPSAAIGALPREARLHEPSVALDGGPDGLAVYRRLVADSPAWLKTDGNMLIEVGRRQAAAAIELLAEHGFAAKVHACDDLAATVVHARLRN